MKATQKLHELGQSVWLDNITRDLLTSGTLRRYIDDLSRKPVSTSTRWQRRCRMKPPSRLSNPGMN